MASGIITSGTLVGGVWQYTQNRTTGKITVTGKKVSGVNVSVSIDPVPSPGLGAVASPVGSGTPPAMDDWTQNVTASLGTHTLVVSLSGGQDKELVQQINVV